MDFDSRAQHQSWMYLLKHTATLFWPYPPIILKTSSDQKLFQPLRLICVLGSDSFHHSPSFLNSKLHFLLLRKFAYFLSACFWLTINNTQTSCQKNVQMWNSCYNSCFVMATLSCVLLNYNYFFSLQMMCICLDCYNYDSIPANTYKRFLSSLCFIKPMLFNKLPLVMVCMFLLNLWQKKPNEKPLIIDWILKIVSLTK